MPPTPARRLVDKEDFVNNLGRLRKQPPETAGFGGAGRFSTKSAALKWNQNKESPGA